MGGKRSLILVVCKSRKMRPSFQAKSEGSQVRCGVWMPKITREAKTHGRPRDIVVGWKSVPWSIKHPTVEGNHSKTKCFVAKAGCKAWILLVQLCPQPCSQGIIACVTDCQVLTLSRVPSAPFQSSPIKTNSPGTFDRSLCLLAEYGYI